MSHIVQITTEVRDAVAVGAACQRLKLEAPTHDTVKLFSGEATGVIVKLPGWKYPAVFDTESGQARYDNYNGRWGKQAQLDRFLQGYAVEKGITTELTADQGTGAVPTTGESGTTTRP